MRYYFVYPLVSISVLRFLRPSESLAVLFILSKSYTAVTPSPVWLFIYTPDEAASSSPPLGKEYPGYQVH